jgi:ribonuclease HI
LPGWTAHFDGLFEPRFTDRGIATYGFVVRHGSARAGEGKGFLAGPGAPASANFAEFGALMHALQWLEEHKRDEEPIVVRGDSRLVVETVAGRWKLSSPRLLPLRELARQKIAALGVPVTLEKVSREENAEADRLSREAYHEAKSAHPEWRLSRPPARL